MAVAVSINKGSSASICQVLPVLFRSVSKVLFNTKSHLITLAQGGRHLECNTYDLLPVV